MQDASSTLVFGSTVLVIDHIIPLFCASNLRILITRNNWTVESLDFYTKSVLLCLNVQTVWCCFKSPCRTVLDCICTTVSFLRCTQLFLFSKWNPSDPWFERAWTLHLSTWELCSQSAVSDFIILFLTSITDARCDSSLFCFFFFHVFVSAALQWPEFSCGYFSISPKFRSVVHPGKRLTYIRCHYFRRVGCDVEHFRK